ncbi:hypothetical protein PP707_00380 [Acetobacter pasteurianus]|nr:hypothetical protein [Acetobacter pasteurianus]
MLTANYHYYNNNKNSNKNNNNGNNNLNNKMKMEKFTMLVIPHFCGLFRCLLGIN